ncbi:MAG: SRPBCC family protein [Vicinamibacterales bacterium]
MATAVLNRIDRTIDVNAPLDRVWRVLTTTADLSAWFKVSIEGDIAAGAEVWMTSLYPGHEGQRFLVRITEMTPPRRFAWQWHPGAVDPAVDYSREPWTTVTFILEPSGAGTRLSMSETGFNEISLARRAKVFKDNTQGWGEVMVWIQTYAEAKN